ncbi:MAG TPA: hypothetical protein VI136_25350 [Verrucomicrobiae bacterium]
MKKTLLSLLVLAITASLAHATLIYTNGFVYPDGDLTAVSSGEWTNHSGSGTVKVVNEKAVLSQALGEDVSAGLPGGPYTSATTLYAGFVVNFSALPLGSGGYFWHYRDTGTAFKARVFATTNGTATPDTYRVGIANGGNTPVVIPKDLPLNQDVKLVVRIVGGTACTLWINPTAGEELSGDKADGTDTTSAVNLHSVCLRQSTASGAGMGVLILDNLAIGTEFLDVQSVGGPPTIGAIANQHISANASTGPLAFTVGDVETPADDLVVTATSDNPTVVPNNPANITLGGSGTDRTVNITATSSQGTATIELVVRDGNNETATNFFRVFVGEPTISAIADQTTATNTVLGPLAFTVNDAETPAGGLTVTPSSSNEGLIPAANISVANLGGPNRSVTITPVPETAGIATITLTVGDGTWSIPTSFTVTVFPKLGVLINEPFTYPDGPIVGNGGWTSHSGTNGDCQVLNNQLSLSYALSEDVSTNLPGFYVDANSGTILYSSVKVNFSALPGSGTEYFMHYRDAGTSNYRARVSATTSGAAAGKFRIAIANSASTAVTVPVDLSLNTTYLVVTRYNVSTGISTVWVNPASETMGGVTATVGSAPLNLYYLSFRQNSGIGALTVDDLKVGTEWGDVWESVAPAPEALKAQQIGNDLVLSWSNPAFSLQAAPTVSGVYTNVPGAASPFTTPLTGERYFRLKY